MKSRSKGGTTFAGMEAAPLLAYNFTQHLTAELGAGVEWWPSYSDPGLVVLGNVAWKFRTWGWLDRVFVGVSEFLSSPQGTPASSTATGSTTTAMQLKLGLGISL